jgi:hypothetical protein
VVLSRKGVVFTFDTFVAVLLLVFFSSMVFQISTPRSDHLRTLSLSRIANDFLVVADRMGVLDSFDNDTMQAFMNQTLDPKLHARVDMEVYNRTFGVSEAFNVSRLNESLPGEFVTSRRIVNKFNETGNLTEIALYKLYLWWGDLIV